MNTSRLSESESADFSFGVHLAAGVLYSLVLLPNTLLALAVLCRSDLHNVVNWAVCNVLLSTACRCLSMAVYCLVKTGQLSPPNSGDVDFLEGGIFCGFLTGLVLIFLHGPLWSIVLLAVAATTRHSHNEWLRKHLTTFRFVELRLLVAILDIIHVCFLMKAIQNDDLLTSSQCTWQLVVHTSAAFTLPHYVLIGLTAFSLLLLSLSSLRRLSLHKIEQLPWCQWTLTSVVLAVIVSLCLCVELSPSLSNTQLILAAETLFPAFCMLLLPCVLLLVDDSLQKMLRDGCVTQQDDNGGRGKPTGNKNKLAGHTNTAFEMELDEGFSELTDTMSTSRQSSQSSPSGESGQGSRLDDNDLLDHCNSCTHLVPDDCHNDTREYTVIVQVHASHDGHIQ